MKYIALLRGINVGGHRIIPMAKLKSLFEAMGMQNVRTVIQSGNVLFDSAQNKREVRASIEKNLLAALTYEVTTLIRTVPEMKKIIAGCAFAKEHAKGKTKLYVAFLEKKPGKKEQAALLATQVQGMKFHIGEKEIYCLLNTTFSGNDSPFSNVKIEKVLQQKATTRNWATTCTLLDLSHT